MLEVINASGKVVMNAYGAVGLGAALSESGGHEGRSEDDGGAHSCCL